MKCPLGPQVHFSMQQVLNIHRKRAKVKRRPLLLQIDQKIDIALHASITARHRTEDAHVRRAVLAHESKDSLASVFNHLVHGRVPE